MLCTSCGSQVPTAAKFCPTCGTPQTGGEEERRIVSVLFADIVGFTALAEHLDPEETKHLVDRYFERLAQDVTAFGGVIDKILGDGMVALFGAPTAHEDDPERAVRAGLRMQQSLLALNRELKADVKLRIGVNTGEVLVGVSSAGGDYTAMGDVMNSASRLESEAEPGQVVVGPGTYAATKEAVSYRDLGSLEVKGRGTIRAWSAVNTIRPPGARTRRSTNFVGRETELNLLMAHSKLALDNSRSQAVMVMGEAGMGKTRLVEEAAGFLASAYGARVLEGRSIPYGEANVWWPIAELVRRAFSLPNDAALGDAKAILEASLAPRISETLRAEIPGYVTALLHALGYETPLRGGDRSRNRSQVIAAVSAALEAELRTRPVVLVLSDMHWASEAVWELLAQLLAEFPRERFVVMMTARKMESNELLQGRHGSLLIQLGPLEDSASRDLLHQLAADLGEKVVSELVQRSGGNPFFLEELASLVAAQAEAEQSDVVAGLGAGLGRLPDTLRGIISARLDALEGRSRTVVEIASVLGRSGRVDGLKQLVDQAQGWVDISAEIADLDSADLLRISGGRFEFRSELVRDVAYGTLTKTVRASLHSGIASYLESLAGADSTRNSYVVGIAHHIHAAAMLINEFADVEGIDRDEVNTRALKWLAEAGQRALDAGAPSDAERWYTDGLQLVTDNETEAEFRYGRAKARAENNDLTGARADLARLSSEPTTEPSLSAKILLVRGDVDRMAGDFDQAAIRLGQAAKELEQLGESSEQALALRLLGMSESYRGKRVEAQQAFEAALAASMGDRLAEAWSLQSLAWFWLRSGDLTAAKELVGQADSIFQELDDSGGLVWTRGLDAWVAFHRGDFERATSLIQMVLPEVRRRSDPWAEGVMLNLLSAIELWNGHATKAQELAVKAALVASRANDSGLEVEARLLQGRSLVSQGRVAEGSQVLEEAFLDADASTDSEARRRSIVVNCSSAARLGESERAIRWANRYQVKHSDAVILGEGDLAVSLALALLQRGLPTEALKQLDWIDERMAQIGSEDPASARDSFAQAVGAVCAATMGNEDLALTKLDQVARVSATYLDRVLALLASAALSVRANKVEDARGAIAEGRDLLAVTDDQLTPLIVDIAAGEFGLGDPAVAAQAAVAIGVDPSGWATVWSAAVGKPPSSQQHS